MIGVLSSNLRGKKLQICLLLILFILGKAVVFIFLPLHTTIPNFTYLRCLFCSIVQTQWPSIEGKDRHDNRQKEKFDLENHVLFILFHSSHVVIIFGQSEREKNRSLSKDMIEHLCHYGCNAVHGERIGFSFLSVVHDIFDKGIGCCHWD